MLRPIYTLNIMIQNNLQIHQTFVYMYALLLLDPAHGITFFVCYQKHTH